MYIRLFHSIRNATKNMSFVRQIQERHHFTAHFSKYNNWNGQSRAGCARENKTPLFPSKCSIARFIYNNITMNSGRAYALNYAKAL